MSATLTHPAGALRGIGHALTAAMAKLGHSLIAMAESGPQMAQIRKLNATSDADLAARGLTREGEIRRIFGPRFYI